MEYSDIKKGAYLVMKEAHPCKVVDVAVSKTGKHGHAKKSVTGIDVISDVKCVQLFVHSSHIEVPEISRDRYLLNYIDDEGFMDLMNDNNNNRSDIKLDDSKLADEIREKYKNGEPLLVTILSATVKGKTQYRIMEYKIDSN